MMTRRLFALSALLLLGITTATLHSASASVDGNDRLPDGSTFLSWELPPNWTRTYHVDQRNPEASDQNPGTAERPWKTIQKAADTLQPGERVLIHAGTYREWVKPVRGGTSAAAMIGYCAAEGEEVVLTGSDLWSAAWQSTTNQDRPAEAPPTWRAELPPVARGGSAFSRKNFPKLEEWKKTAPDFFNETNPANDLRCGQMFLDGEPLAQVGSYADLLKTEHAFWVEGDEAVHVRLRDDASPAGRDFEISVREQVFAPTEKFLNYVRVGGLKIRGAANGIPIPYPQKGAVSATLGHHWIIEDCEIGHANGIGADIGGQWWDLSEGRMLGCHIVRRNHIHHSGVCGLAGWHAGANQHLLIEDNLIEHCGLLPIQLHQESGGIKLHRVLGSLIRRNVFRHNRNSAALWLDGGCANTRVTQNLFHDTIGLGYGAVFIEITQGPNLIDNNIIVGSDIHGIYATDMARLIVMQNLIANVGKGSAVHLFRAGKWRFRDQVPWEDEQWVEGNVFAGVDRYVQLPNLTSTSLANVLGGRHANAGTPFSLFSEYHPEKNGEYDLAAWNAMGLDAASVEQPMEVVFDERTWELRVKSTPPGAAMPFAGVGVKVRLPSMAGVFEFQQADFLGFPRSPDALHAGPLLNLPLDGTPVKVDPRRLTQP
jgi:hypothetical protein